ncbi:hypothetical protein GOODEAATRI_027229 [Goodea atripinnis]|uniref:Uncharacterized protein n=1 Tax=Goodea atripinnis TaxID=208336 RepID=A0ABV0N5M7_9TELE
MERPELRQKSDLTGLEILELAGNAARNNKKTRTITCSWLSTTIRTTTSCWVESPSLSCMLSLYHISRHRNRLCSRWEEWKIEDEE